VPEKRGEWTVLDNTVLYNNPWITVREDRVIQPDGQEGTFGVVEMKPGVSVLPVDDDGTVYLVRVYRYTLDRDSLEALAGGVEEDEDPVDAARRELREEAGIEATELVDLGVVDQLTEVVVSPTTSFSPVGSCSPSQTRRKQRTSSASLFHSHKRWSGHSMAPSHMLRR
jgi:8-oxo-dGTP pyrophosphatase MutT (NUDIX family)